ncbi:MAG TPA: class I SAM-dependent methyltransferase, partial [Planctomycetota bacterium]|nr:class I SAM-dependent methyltransferase [Planctomycetota bacterium]
RADVPYEARVRYIGDAPLAQYRARSVKRDLAELELLASLLPPRIEGFALDVPSGYGRMSDLLRSRGGVPVSFDISPDMARAACAVSGRGAVAELEHLPLADRSVDLSVCFRLLHHVPTRAQRVAILKELARVSRRFVLVTWFHPWSLHHVRRWIGRDSRRYALTKAELASEALEAGLVLDAVRAQAPFLRDLWLARFKVP